MFLFLLLVFPIVAICHITIHKTQKVVLPLTLGVLSAAITCLFCTFFIFSENVVFFSFSSQFLQILLYYEVLPVFITSCVLFIILKDSFEVRLKVFFPFWIAFYAIYIPYNVISGKTNFDLFELFAEPILYATFLMLLNNTINFVLSKITKAKNYFILLALLVAFIIPPIIHTLWFMGYQWYSWFIPFMLYETFAIFAIIFNAKLQKGLKIC